jgi:hypothetical protein
MKLRIACVVIGFLLLVLPLTQVTVAQTAGQTASALPRLVRFGGTVKDLNGNPVTGVVGITFALYSEEAGGAALWLETQNVTADSNGHYVVLLGSTKPEGLPAELFTSEQARWVGVQVSGQTEQPRMLLVSAPYALKAGDAETIGGLPPSAFALAPTPTGNARSATAPANSSVPPSSALPPAMSNVTTTGGTAQKLPLFTTATNIQNSIVTQTGATAIDVTGKLGVNTAAPAETLDVTSGNAIVRGVGNFTKSGETATLFIGDTSHPIEAAYSTGLSIGAFKAPKAIFIADFTGNVGIGTTKPTTGILNAVATSGSVIGLSVLGWNTPTTSNASGTDAIHATGGNAQVNSPSEASTSGGTGAVINGGEGLNGGAGAVITGGAGGSFGLDAGGGGPGLIVNGGNTLGDFGGGDGIDSYGGPGGNGLVASAGGAFDQGAAAGVIGAGGITAQDQYGAPAGPGLVGDGGSDSLGSGGDGIDAYAGTGCSGCSNGLAGSFTGEVSISGNLSVSGTKSFKIDHPLDPANKYLYHAALESSEVLNLYSGNATLDAGGEARVQLPDWVQVLNRDFRYQLTAIGTAAPNLHIAEEIQNNSFRISGGAAGMKVSWQVTGVRQDAWEKAHPMVVEVQKPQPERGYYINPELFGAPPERNVDWARNPRLMKRLKSIQQKQAAQRQALLMKPVKSLKQ